MAKMVLTDVFVSIGGVDLSNHVKSVSIDYKAEVLDVTAMGATSHERMGGLKDWSCEVEFFQDWAAASVDVSLFSLVGTSVALQVRPIKGTAVGATNPNYSGSAILESYPPVGGGIGEVAMTSISLQGNGVLTRAVV